jgi:methylisocitrate lyase
MRRLPVDRASKQSERKMSRIAEPHDTLRNMIRSPAGLFAPLVLNPLMARFAEMAGFSAAYLGGGAMGYISCGTEANLSLTQMIHAGVEIKAHSRLHLVLDGVCGWGDPVHVRQTVRAAEAAGFAAIEIEDQILPKRVHHHVGIEHMIPCELMEEKVAAAVSARRSKDFLIIARTNAVRVENMDEALRRGEAFHRRGADLLLLMPRNPEEIRIIGERLPHPLMYMLPAAGVSAIGMPLQELPKLGFSLMADSGTPLFAMSHAMRHAYAAMWEGRVDPTTKGSILDEEKAIQAAVGLPDMLEIEERTVGR